MGSKASCSRRTDAVSPDAIRVVHLNGQLDEFPAQVSVKRVLQNLPRHFICCSRDLFAVKCRPLQPDEDLRLGELYFLLPLSILESDLSAENLVALAARLYAAARKEVSRAAQRRRSADSACDLPGEGRSSMYEELLRSCEDPEVKIAFREHLISKSRSWRPRLHTIEETGFAC
jgi:hypothetical protein